ncbi:hypothetical protein PanWU01x14_030340 [Parasponia andersonii]|uniref:Transmembrane protein n=1 Tax=Parasponia andersonii TaxID=3476 RepID=A0A2P5DUR1_PARAD|nr:hypothetical protein PanWU01x14_030340 [Parasponia andersonii]
MVSGTDGSSSEIESASTSGLGSTDGATIVGDGDGGFEVSTYDFPAITGVEPGGFGFFYIRVVFTVEEDPHFFLGVTIPLVFTIIVMKLAAQRTNKKKEWSWEKRKHLREQMVERL